MKSIIIAILLTIFTLTACYEPVKEEDSGYRQCKAITLDGTRCKRFTNDTSGYCWQHRKK